MMTAESKGSASLGGHVVDAPRNGLLEPRMATRVRDRGADREEQRGARLSLSRAVDAKGKRSSGEHWGKP